MKGTEFLLHIKTIISHLIQYKIKAISLHIFHLSLNSSIYHIYVHLSVNLFLKCVFHIRCQLVCWPTSIYVTRTCTFSIFCMKRALNLLIMVKMKQCGSAEVLSSQIGTDKSLILCALKKRYSKKIPSTVWADFVL